MRIRTKVRALRLGRGIERVADLAKAVRIATPDVYRFERQELRLSQRQLEKLAGGLGAKIEEFAGPDGFALPM